jgi:diguanylate cyclase (GGDEF)-like protein
MSVAQLAGRFVRTVVAIFAALLSVGLVAYLDYRAGSELNLEPLYFLPVGIAAWYAGSMPSAVVAAVSTAAWRVANEAAGVRHALAHWLPNMAFQLVACALVGVLVAYLRRRVEREEWSSRHDALTGLPNVRAFHERADQELARARRYGGPLTIAYLDLDNFKALNDQLGHRAGDRALRLVGELLLQSARASDVAARLGGDEFVILMPETSAEGAHSVLERLRAELARAFSEFCPRASSAATGVSVSIGAVTFVQLPESVEQLLGAADDRMYAVKRAGKNLVRVDVQAMEQTPTGTA